ncbi:hypothetical protein [Mucisphaera calidilacus]|uniref:Uncharacterized protein n=1 Tax=Mucisphaera calidilacus TaxID=2527982 RepID=A0A518BV81_9BACT|nr:hypothetical protein [Mucisphaera calidilacus]QDU70885.1 hypothetical protein Pan265_07260 [Mucisphaera calidilacus]
MAPAVVISLILAGLAYLILKDIISTRRRRAAMTRLAVELGMSYDIETYDHRTAMHCFAPIFQSGEKRRSLNVLRNDGPNTLLIFDYQYKPTAPRARVLKRQTVFVHQLPGLRYPKIEARPENLDDFIDNLFGKKDIDFTEDPGFSKRYWVKAENEIDARAVLDPRTRRLLLKTPYWTVQILFGSFVFFISGKRIKPADIPEYLRETQDILDAMTALPQTA